MTVAELNVELCASGIGKATSPIQLWQIIAQLDSTRQLAPPIPPPPVAPMMRITGVDSGGGTVTLITDTGLVGIYKSDGTTTVVSATVIALTNVNLPWLIYASDFSGNPVPSITSIDLAVGITGIDVSELTELTYLNLNGSGITGTLDLSGLTNLLSAQIYDNSITSLLASGCSSLGDLACYNNDFPTLDLTGCGNLIFLNCGFNFTLTDIVVDDCLSLQSLEMSSTSISFLTIAGLSLIGYVNANNSSLSNISYINCFSVTDFNFQNCQFSAMSFNSLDLPSLATLDMSLNLLVFLDIPVMANLLNVAVNDNPTFGQTEISDVVSDLDNTGSSGGNLSIANTYTPLNSSGADAVANLIFKSWTVTWDGA